MPSQGDENETRQSQAIIDGTPATRHHEAVLIDMLQDGEAVAACSGALIATRVVLTAGHCVADFDSWRITAPYADNASSKSSSGITMDYPVDNGEAVPTDAHDVGLIFLDDAIQLDSYPAVATDGLQDGASVRNLGRIKGGIPSETEFFVSKPVTIQSAEEKGFPYSYVAKEVIEQGDSGGPVELVTDDGSVKIVAVNSGGGTGIELLARVDLVHDWIKKNLAAH